MAREIWQKSGVIWCQEPEARKSHCVCTEEASVNRSRTDYKTSRPPCSDLLSLVGLHLLRAPPPFQHAHQLGIKVSDWRAYGDISYSKAQHLISSWPWFGTRCLFTVHYTCRHTMRQQQTPLGTHCLPSETVLWLWITVPNGLCSLLLSQKHNSSITVNPDVECILPTTP